MRRAFVLTVAIAVLSIGALAAGQSSGEKYLGTWAGTWDGAGSGDFELTIDQAKDGPLSGRVAVTTDGGNYNANLKTITFDGPKMIAKYDFPLDANAEIVMNATFEGNSAKGTWAMRPKGQDADVAAGTFSVNKK